MLPMSVHAPACATQVALTGGGLLGEDVALERRTALDGAPGRTRNRLAALFLVFILGMLLLLRYCRGQAAASAMRNLLACNGFCFAAEVT
jgi:hypothetical protein